MIISYMYKLKIHSFLTGLVTVVATPYRVSFNIYIENIKQHFSRYLSPCDSSHLLMERENIFLEFLPSQWEVFSVSV